MPVKSTLYLIPSPIDGSYNSHQVPLAETERIAHLRVFVVENLKHARRYLRKLLPEVAIDDCTFYEMGKHATPESLSRLWSTMKSGTDAGVISEAGLPGVADPGGSVVSMAHQMGMRVIPLIGPGSIFMALMASGFNGQQFSFHGYLPREGADRSKKIRELESQAHRTGYTQIFMETPFRNNALLDDILKSCGSSTMLCIARAISQADECINTRSIQDWQKSTPNLHKVPVIFLIGKI
ncbi:MAG: SAM-dependent methyltransferase [Cryomorphaceae bacterium]|nr:MAG: SAM-dependent methyltransferase [Cryomorphaceae bacterium]